MTIIRRTPLAAQTAEALLARIQAGEWELGDKLPGETQLAAQFGVGRSTLREAIRELAGKGILGSRQGSGVFLTARDATADWDQLLRNAAISAVLEARMAIETEAAALAAQRRTPADLAAMGMALANRLPVGSTEQNVDTDLAFHRAVVLAAHNDVLTELFDAFVPRSRAAMIDMLRERPLASPHNDHVAHAELLAAIGAGDACGAAESSRTHLRGLKARLA